MTTPSTSGRALATASDAVGEAPCFDVIYREHAAYVRRLATRLTGSPDDGDEITQDVFVAALEGLGALRDRSKVRSWLRTVTVRRARRRLRWRAFKRRFSPILDGDRWPSASGRDAELASALVAALEDLAPEERTAWVLRHVEGHELEVVSEALGRSLATTKRRLARATERLRRRMR